MNAGAARTVDARPAAEDWKRVFALLDAALELPQDAVEPWLAALAGTDPVIAATVTDLLARRGEATGTDFLRPPGASTRAHVPLVAPQPATHDAEVVGPYRLLEQIGRGGTATVWLAERTDGFVDRRVALKLPDVAGPQPPGFAERIDRERRILASLAHPNIARLYDAGLADDGRPYLALEYIAGQPIDVHARTHDLATHRRVRLLIDVARAVAHAHGRLVVHRDLKPSNILVDQAGAVHLLDFGIAKLIDPSLDDPHAHTLIAGRALTPDYASPEQLRGEPIGTASDLYSLGVVAFELLTGRRPRDAVSIGAGPSPRARDEPPRPSAMVDDPARRRELRGDLDAIVSRLLAPMPGDRYATMEALADDLERHLAHLPVEARTASRSYVLRRWVSRHRLETGIGIALLVAIAGGAYAQAIVALAIGIGALLVLWQREQAVRQAARVRVALERSDAVKSFIASIFTEAVPRAGRGGPVAAIDLLKHAARRVETDLAAQPEVLAELSAVIGASLNELGDVKAGALWLPKTVERCTRVFGPMHRLTLQSRRRWMEAANTVGDIATVEAQLPSLLADLRAVRPPEPQLLVETLQSQAFMSTKRGREHEAMAALNEAIAVALDHDGPASPVCLSARISHSNTLVHFGRFAEALDAIEPAIAPAYALYASQRPHLLLTAVERCHGDALVLCGCPRDGGAVLRQVLTDQRALDVDETTRVRVVMTMLARAMYFGGHFEEAAALFAEAAEMHLRLTDGHNDEAAGAWTWLALANVSLGRVDEAAGQLERARRAADTRVPAFVQRAHSILCHALVANGQGHWDAALELVTPILDDERGLPDAQRLRGERVRVHALRQRGDVDAAIERATVAVDGVGPARSALEWGLLVIELARCHRTRGDEREASAMATRVLAAWESGQVDGRAPIDAVKTEFRQVSEAPTT